MKRVQICGCFEAGEDVIPFVPDSVAEFWGVYIGDTTMEWLADFSRKVDALLYADTLVKQGYELDDRTFARREE
jgi:hypothetical protein